MAVRGRGGCRGVGRGVGWERWGWSGMWCVGVSGGGSWKILIYQHGDSMSFYDGRIYGMCGIPLRTVPDVTLPQPLNRFYRLMWKDGQLHGKRYLGKRDCHVEGHVYSAQVLSCMPRGMVNRIEWYNNKEKWDSFCRGWNAKVWSGNGRTTLKRWRSVCTPCMLIGSKIWYGNRHRSMAGWVDYMDYDIMGFIPYSDKAFKPYIFFLMSSEL